MFRSGPGVFEMISVVGLQLLFLALPIIAVIYVINLLRRMAESLERIAFHLSRPPSPPPTSASQRPNDQ